MKHNCETIQFNISDKLDSSQSISDAEHAHLENCQDCQRFYELFHSEHFQEIAASSAQKTFDIEQVAQTAAIMEKLEQGQGQELSVEQPKRRKIISIGSVSLATAAAAVAMVTISKMVQPSDNDELPAAVAQVEQSNAQKISLPKLAISEIKFEEKYAKFNSVVVDKIETVSYSFMKLKACFAEGNAFLDEHTQESDTNAPESRYFFEDLFTIPVC